MTIPLPKTWTKHIKSAMLQLFGLANFAATVVVNETENDLDWNPFETTIIRLEQTIRTLNEKHRITDQRMERIPASRRPHYTPDERLQILELKAVCSWSSRQTAREFQVAAATIASWVNRVDEDGPEAMLKTSKPVNEFSDLVSYSVSRLKTLCPALGKVKIAEILCRAGLHLSVSTVGRMIMRNRSGFAGDSSSKIEDESRNNSGSDAKPEETSGSSGANLKSEAKKKTPIVSSKYPNHVWHVDMTVVPTGGGFWTPWFPHSLPQCWPFCWWVVIVMDHFSRKIIGFAVFKKQPSAIQVRTFLGSAMGRAKSTPKYIISDKGGQFWCSGYKRWCKRKGIKPRFGAIGQHGSIAVIERFNRTFKEFTRALAIVPMKKKSFQEEAVLFLDWYNERRPHMALAGKTPNDVYDKGKFPANRRPRIEPREKWPRRSRCAKPQTLVAGQPGDQFEIQIDFHEGRSHLPIVSLKRAA